MKTAEEILKEKLGDWWYISGKHQKEMIEAMIEFAQQEKVNELNKSDVSGRSELLFAFVKYLQSENAVDSAVSYYIDDFLSKQ